MYDFVTASQYSQCNKKKIRKQQRRKRKKELQTHVRIYEVVDQLDNRQSNKRSRNKKVRQMLQPS